MVDDRDTAELTNAVISALLDATPERYRSIEYIVHRAGNQFGHRLTHDISCPDFPDECMSYPTGELHQATYLFMEAQEVDILSIQLKLESDGWSYSIRTKPLQRDEIYERERTEGENALRLEVYDARQEFFECHLGPFPDDIIKIADVYWTSGGLVDMEMRSAGGARACFTFGLSNPDLPATMKVTGLERKVEEHKGRKAVETVLRLEPAVPRYVPPELSGCGYEVMLLCPAGDDRYIGALTWFVQSELNLQQELVESVLEHEGLTIESIPLLDGTVADFVVYPAVDLVPPVYCLPSGDMNVLIATRITRAEMNFARTEGRRTLIRRLQDAGIGQLSIYDRESVV